MEQKILHKHQIKVEKQFRKNILSSRTTAKEWICLGLKIHTHTFDSLLKSYTIQI